MQASFDPVKFMREVYDKSEESSTKYWETLMGTEAWAIMANSFLESYLKQHSTVNNALGQTLKYLKLPTQDDFARLASLIVALEDKVDRLEDSLERISDLLETSLAKEAKKKVGRNTLSETAGR